MVLIIGFPLTDMIDILTVAIVVQQLYEIPTIVHAGAEVLIVGILCAR